MTRRLKFGIFEISTHENSLIDIIKISNFANYSLVVFTSEKIKQNIIEYVNSKNIEWVIKKPTESLNDYLTRIRPITQKLNILYFFPLNGSLLDFVTYFRNFPFPCPVILSIYRGNSLLMRNIEVNAKIYNLPKILILRRIANVVDCLTVEYESVKEHILNYSSFNIFTFTPVLTSNFGKQQDTESEIIIAVPGLVDCSRRNYKMLLDALNNLPYDLSLKLNIQLLGRPVGRCGNKIVDNVRNIHRNNIKIKTYNNWIPKEEFDRVMAKSDVILSPLERQKLAHGVINEVYGTSKGSGVVSDAIRYRKPLLLPSFYQVPPRLRSSTLFFDSSEQLSSILLELSESESFISARKQAAKENSRHYAIYPQRKRLKQIVGELIDHNC